LTPLPQREVLVAALADLASVGKSLDDSFARWRESEPAVALQLEGAEQVTPLLCSYPLASRARTGVAPGVILLGDAAGFVDPITGGGMTQALMSAE
jgi:flavin-dependent dehydrogenase